MAGGPAGFALNEEDRQIVQIVRELSRQLNISEISANTVSWADRLGLGKAPPEYVGFWLGDIRLPTVLRGKLSPEEWRPLLASALLYYVILRKRLLRMLATTVLLPLLSVGPGFVLVVRGLGTQMEPSQVLSSALGLMLVVFFLSMLPFTRWIARLRLRADIEAAQLVGRDALRRSLEKVEDVAGRRLSILALLHLKPTIAERIGSLG